MTSSLRKKIYYLRASQSNMPFNITEILLSKNFNDVSSTKRVVQGVSYRIQHSKIFLQDNNKCLFLHIVSGIEGETALTMNMDCRDKEDDGCEQFPPEKHEFIKSEACLILSQHHVVFCSHGLNAKSVEAYLNTLLHDPDCKNLFCFSNITDVNKLELIAKHGIKSIALSTSAYDLTVNDLNDRYPSNPVLSKVIKSIKTLVAKETSELEDHIKQQLQVNLSINLLGNTRATSDAKKLFNHTGNYIVHNNDYNEDDIVLITGNDEKIKNSDIKLNKTVKINKLNRSNAISHYDAYEQLKTYLIELKGNNFIEI